MDMNNVNIEEIVKQVLAGMAGTAPAASASAAPAAPAAAPAGAIPKTAHVAVLTEKEHFDIKEYPIPAIGDDDILVKVEGCGVCGTDAHEFKRDPFNLIPVALGHEGTGEIVAMGKNVKTDTAGKPVKIGDKVVTCMIFKDDPEITMFDLNKKNVGGADVYGLLPDDDIHLNGWFSDYIFIRGGEFGSTFFNVSDLDLDSRILIEPCAVLVHAVERAKTTGILRFNSRVVVQGCGPIGLICIAVLRTMGIENICAVDGNQQRLDFAKRMGATMSVNFMEHKGIEALSEAVKDQFGGHLADFAFQWKLSQKSDFKQTGSKHRVILELLTYLDEHYDQDIGLSELADRAGMSTAYLSVLFKTEVGTSYVKYLTDLRIKKAKKLLQDGYKVNEVSEMVGYNNYRYFCDIFKKHEGMTPNEYKGNVWKAE